MHCRDAGPGAAGPACPGHSSMAPSIFASILPPAPCFPACTPLAASSSVLHARPLCHTHTESRGRGRGGAGIVRADAYLLMNNEPAITARSASPRRPPLFRPMKLSLATPNRISLGFSPNFPMGQSRSGGVQRALASSNLIFVPSTWQCVPSVCFAP